MSVTEPELRDPALAAVVDLARAAAQDEAGDEPVGAHVGTRVEAETTATHFFEADKPGYGGWRWAVTVASAGPDTEVTVSEVVLLPGPDALVAPEWVPWERRVRAGDLGVGDLLPTQPDDARLVPAYVWSDDPAVEEVAREVGLGRVRVLARPARLEAATRWQLGEFGPRSDMARSAPAHCGTCAFYLPLAGSLRAAFGTCGNEFSPADGRVVHAEYGCGAHSEAEVEQPSPVLVANLIYDDAQLEVAPTEPAAAEPPEPTEPVAAAEPAQSAELALPPTEATAPEPPTEAGEAGLAETTEPEAESTEMEPAQPTEAGETALSRQPEPAETTAPTEATPTEAPEPAGSTGISVAPQAKPAEATEPAVTAWPTEVTEAEPAGAVAPPGVAAPTEPVEAAEPAPETTLAPVAETPPAPAVEPAEVAEPAPAPDTVEPATIEAPAATDEAHTEEVTSPSPNTSPTELPASGYHAAPRADQPAPWTSRWPEPETGQADPAPPTPDEAREAPAQRPRRESWLWPWQRNQEQRGQDRPPGG